MQCPRCGSTHVSKREAGKRAGATVLGLSAAALGTITAMRGAQVGATIGVVGGPVGVATGGLLGAIVAGMFAGSAGCAVGSVIGSLADANFLDNRACLDCGHYFRGPADPAPGVNVNIHAGAPGEGSVAMRHPLQTAGMHPGQFYEE